MKKVLKFIGIVTFVVSFAASLLQRKGRHITVFRAHASAAGMSKKHPKGIFAVNKQMPFTVMHLIKKISSAISTFCFSYLLKTRYSNIKQKINEKFLQKSEN